MESTLYNNYGMRLSLCIILAILHTPTAWTWTNIIASSPSSRVTHNSPLQRTSPLDDSSPRQDRLTILRESNYNSDDNDVNEHSRSRRHWNRLNFRRRRRNVVQLHASSNTNDDDNEEEVDGNNNNQVNQFLEKAQQAWTTSPPKISMNELNKTGGRESLLNSYKSVSQGSNSSTANGDDSMVDKSSVTPPPLKGASSFPFNSSPFNSMPKKSGVGVATTKSYGGKWGGVSKGSVGKKSSGIGGGGGGIPPPPVRKSVPKGTEPSSSQPPAVTAAAASIEKSPSAFLKEFAKSKAPKSIPPPAKGSLKTNNDNISNSNNSNNNNNDEAKYLTLAKEAWTKFFSNQVSQEEYVNMALDAWRDASLVKLQQQGGDDDDVVKVEKEEGVTPSAEQRQGDNDDDDTTTTTTLTSKDEKEGGKDTPASFFSGLKKSLFPTSSKSSGDNSVLSKGGDGSSVATKKEEEEDIPYGLRMKSSSESVPPPPAKKSSTMKMGGNKSDSLKDFVNSIKNGKPPSEKQVTPPPPPQTKKGAVSPIKSEGEKQITPPTSLKKGIGSPKQLDTTVKKDWQGNRGGLSFLKSDKAEQNYNPMNKGVTAEKIKGVMKGKESSLGGDDKLLSSKSPTLNKGGATKLGIQGKFAPKKFDTTAKKDWQGNRGGLSFLKSDKLSKEYKAEKNYNPMNKGLTAEKIKGLKIGKAKVEDEESSIDDVDDDEQLEETKLELTPPPVESTVERAPASKIERWSKDSFKPILKGSESDPVADEIKSELPAGKTTTISITDQGGTDVVNPGRAFIPAPPAIEDTGGMGGGGVKFASSKLGIKSNIPFKGGVKKFGSTPSGSAKLLASKSGLLSRSTGAKKFGSPGAGGFLNKGNAKKIDFSLLKKGGVAKGTKLPFQNGAPKMMGVKSKGFPSQPINGLGVNGVSKSSIADPQVPTLSVPPESLKKATSSSTVQPKAITRENTVPSAITEGVTAEEEARTKGMSKPDAQSMSSTDVRPGILEGMTAEEAQRVREGRLEIRNEINLKAKTASPVKTDNAEELSPATELISDGMTAEEAERIRTRRLQPEEDTTTMSEKAMETSSVAPTAITEGMTAEEAKRARNARLEASDEVKKNPKTTTKDLNKVESLPNKKSTLPYYANKSIGKAKEPTVKGGMSMGEKQAGLPGKGMPFMKKAPSFSMDKKSLPLPPLPLKGKGDAPKSLSMPPLTKKSFGDAGAGAGAGLKKGFPAAPLTMKKGPMAEGEATADDEESDASVSKGLPLKGGMSMGEKQDGLLPGKGMSFMKRAPSFSMDKKSLPLPPLPLKGKGDAPKSLGMPPLTKKSFGDAGAGVGLKKGFPAAPLTMKKGPMAEGEATADDEVSDTSVSKGLPLKGGMSMGEKQAGLLPGKGMPFMKKAPSFSMDKKSLPLPPLPLKGEGDAPKSLGMPPLTKKSFGDAGAGVGLKKGFPAAPLTMKKGPMAEGEATADDEVSDTSVSKGLPLKGGMSMGEKQAGLLPGKGMPFMKKAPSFSMDKKSLPLPPLPLKGEGDAPKSLGMPPLTKKSFGDAGAGVGLKKGFPAAPLTMKKGPMAEGEATADDEESDASVSKGLPLKGGMSMGEKQAGLPGKGMPFMKKAPSFSMDKKSLPLPPLPLKGKGDAPKSLGMPPLTKKSFGDAGAGAGAGLKKGFPAAPLTMKKGPMADAEATADDEESDASVSKGFPLKGGMSMGEKQAGLPGKGMPFMKKAPSFSMDKKSLPLPPLPLKGKGDAPKSLGMPPLTKKSFGDAGAGAGLKKGFPAAPLTIKKGPMAEGEATADDEESDTSVSKGLPLKGGMSMGEKQARLPGKGMPFMKKASSFSMDKKSLPLPPLPLKGKGDAPKSLGMPPLTKKSFGDAGAGVGLKKGFPAAPLTMKKGPMAEGEATADDEVSDTSVSKGLPLKGGMSMGEKQAGLLPGKGMPFMKKAPSFSMDKKSLPLPPLPLKGEGDAPKSLGMPPLTKKSFGDAGAGVGLKKGFPAAPLTMKKGPMAEGEATADDEESDASVSKGLPLKGGMSMGEKQAGLPGKGMPFMKRAPSFSMDKKSLPLPPLPLKGKGDAPKSLGMPPLTKKSFGDAGAGVGLKKGFPAAPLTMKKGPMAEGEATADDEVSDTSVSKGLPLKGGMSMGEKQDGLLPGKGMPFMKKAPSFSMDKKSLPLPPLPLKGEGDAPKSLGMPPLTKKSFGDAGAGVGLKKGFPAAPLTMKKGPMAEGEATADDEVSDTSVSKGLPLKGGMSMGEKQAGLLPGKGMPFMKKAPSFSMDKKSLPLPPLPLKGEGDAPKSLGMPPLTKKSFGDAGAGVGLKKGFPAAPLTMKKGPMAEGEATADDEVSDTSVSKGLPLKGGMSMGEKQAGLPGKGMPFMKKAPSFSMDKKSLPLPPLPLKGKGDAPKSLGMPPLTKKSFGDADAGLKKGFPAAPLTMKKGTTSVAGETKAALTDATDVVNDKVDVSDEVTDGDSSVSSWTSTPDKELGKGAAFLPKFSTPPMRGEAKDPNDFSWLESSEAIDIGTTSSGDDSNDDGAAKLKEARNQSQPKGPVKLWGGESFLGTSSSRVYGLGSSQPPKSSGSKENEVIRAKSSDSAAAPVKKDSPNWARNDATNAARLMDEMNDSINAVEKRLVEEMKESMVAEEKRLIEEKTKIAALLHDTEKRLSSQLEKFEEETKLLRDDKARADAERLEAENRIQEIEAARIRAEKEAEQWEQRFAEEKSALSAKLSDAEQARTDNEKRLIEEKTKVAALISEAEKKLAMQLEKFEQERVKMNLEKETAAAERSEAQRKVEEADLARIKAEKEAKMLETLLTEQKSKQEKWMEEQRLLTKETLEKRIAEERSKIDAALADAKAKEETRMVEEQKRLVDAQLEQRSAEMRILDIEAARIRAEKEAERLKKVFAEEKSTLSAKLSDAEQARTDNEKRLIEEKTKVAALISEAEKKLAIQLEKFEQERVKMNLEKETAAAERSEAQRKVEEADLARIKAEKEAKMLETLLTEQKSKQEKWMEEQRLLTEETLEKRIAEERSKIDSALADAKAKEEARMVEEQKRLVDAQLEQRLAEEKSKLDAEIAAAEEKIRRELELLESEKSVRADAVKAEAQASGVSPQAAATPPLEEEELALPDEALPSIQDLPKISSTTSDVLTADVEALELISMCDADYDSTSTDSSSDAEACLLPSEYPFVSLLRDSSPYIVNHRHSTIVYHIPGDLITDVEKFNSVMDDIALTWLFGMKIVLCVGCRTQVSERLDRLGGNPTKSKSGVRITTDAALRILEEEAGFCRFEVERQLNRCLRSKGANCNVVSGCFTTAKKFGVVDGVDYQHTGYPKTLQTDRINRFISRNDVVLLTPLGFTEDGHAVNIKSEQLAGFTAGALKASKVVYFSTKPLVMRGSNNSRDANANQRIQMIQRSNALQILSHHGLTIHGKTGFPRWRNPTAAAKNPSVQAMLLQMGWATDAIDKGVERAHIITCDDGALLEELFTARRGYGTCISQDDYEAPHPEDQNDDLLVLEDN